MCVVLHNTSPPLHQPMLAKYNTISGIMTMQAVSNIVFRTVHAEVQLHRTWPSIDATIENHERQITFQLEDDWPTNIWTEYTSLDKSSSCSSSPMGPTIVHVHGPMSRHRQCRHQTRHATLHRREVLQDPRRKQAAGPFDPGQLRSRTTCGLGLVSVPSTTGTSPVASTTSSCDQQPQKPFRLLDGSNRLRSTAPTSSAAHPSGCVAQVGREAHRPSARSSTRTTSSSRHAQSRRMGRLHLSSTSIVGTSDRHYL